MPDRVLTPRTAWLWPLLLVTAVHLFSTSGTWWITDHGEVLAVADRFLNTGRLDLSDLGPGYEDWIQIVKARGSTDTRFLPLSILLLTPLLALDHAMGWRDPASFRFVYLQGHLCIGLALALIARYLTRRGAGDQTTALAVLLLGLNWPVWMIARRLGPEPILFLLLAVFGVSGTRTRVVVLFLLPWVHATGPLVGLGALLWLGVEAEVRSAAAWRKVALAWAFGGLSLALFWNLLVHGSLFLGGYGRYSSDPFFTVRNPLVGGALLIGVMIAWTLPLWLLVVRNGKRSIIPTLVLWLPLVGFLGLFSTPEPERRLSPLLAPWIITVMAASRPLPRDHALGLALLSLLSGVTGLSRDFVDLVSTPFGLFAGPTLLLVRLAFVERHPVLAGTMGLALLTVITVAAARTIPLLSKAPGAVGSNDAADPEFRS